MVANWIEKQRQKLGRQFDKVEEGLTKIMHRTKENFIDSGDLILDSISPREALDPSERIAHLGTESRKSTKISRAQRAAHFTNKQLTEKRMRAVDKIHHGMGSTACETVVAGGVITVSHPHHAITKCGDVAMEAANLSTQFIKESILVDEMNRRGLSEVDCRQPTRGMFRNGFASSAPKALRKAVLRETVHEVKEFAAISDFSDYSSTQKSIPAFVSPPTNTSVYAQSYTPFPAGIPTTPVFTNSYSTYTAPPPATTYTNGAYNWRQ